ncbi:hypothetical protein Hanom_Chr05g00449301 [Helianthus anomalus]
MWHYIRARKMMWHFLRPPTFWFWLQNLDNKNLCIWVNAGSVSFIFDPASFVHICVSFPKP